MNWLRRITSMNADELMTYAPIALASVAIALPAIDAWLRSM